MLFNGTLRFLILAVCGKIAIVQRISGVFAMSTPQTIEGGINVSQ
jgi:hypothetical protein